MSGQNMLFDGVFVDPEVVATQSLDTLRLAVKAMKVPDGIGREAWERSIGCVNGLAQELPVLADAYHGRIKAPPPVKEKRRKKKPEPRKPPQSYL